MDKLTFTMSWDDGSKSDLRLAELLSKYNIKSTFYIPQRNIEGIPVINDSEIRLLANNFEIGGHSIDHVRLINLTAQEQQFQILESKKWLETILGNEIYGFCYPGGKYDSISIDAVKSAGYYYGRTTENFQTFIKERFIMPTTIQFFDHKQYVLYFNILKSKDRRSKIANFFSAISQSTLLQRLESILLNAIESKQEYLHVWGHSWELDKFNMWGDLEEFLKLVNENTNSITCKTNYECAIESNESKS
jgi:hypothetical protein